MIGGNSNIGPKNPFSKGTSYDRIAEVEERNRLLKEWARTSYRMGAYRRSVVRFEDIYSKEAKW